MQITVDKYLELESEVARLRMENRLLTDKVKYLIRKLFGARSEKVDPHQLLLPLGFQEIQEEVKQAIAEVKESRPPKRKRTPRSERLPDHLPVERVIIEPEEVKANPEAYQQIGEEVTVELDVTPAKFFKREIIRPKYVCLADRSLPPVVAAAPKRVIDNSFASVGLLVHLILSKYADHLPLYRQEQICKMRHGVILSRKTMCGWMFLIAHQLALIYEALRNEIRSCGYVQADETPVAYQDPGRGKCGKGYLWVYRASEVGVLFEWFPSRASDCLSKMLSKFQGQLQTDGYNAYEAFYKKEDRQKLLEKVELAACWAHVRRKFFDAREETSLAASVLAKIQKLYQIEAALREEEANSEVRHATRQKESLPILVGMHADLEKAQHQFLPKSMTGKAVAYALELWDRLRVYTRHGHMEIDNNLVENAIRPTAIGKKNWLFFGSPEAGQTSAIFYSLLGTCQMLGINPQEYLLDVLTHLPTMTNQNAPLFTPAKWLAKKNAP